MTYQKEFSDLEVTNLIFGNLPLFHKITFRRQCVENIDSISKSEYDSKR